MVRDKWGRRMSSSLGNVIAPAHIIEGVELPRLVEQVAASHLSADEKKRAIAALPAEFPQGIPACGSDALRFGLLAYTAQTHDIHLDVRRFVSYRQFGERCWRAHHFAFRAFETVIRPRQATRLRQTSSAPFVGDDGRR